LILIQRDFDLTAASRIKIIMLYVSWIIHLSSHKRHKAILTYS